MASFFDPNIVSNLTASFNGIYAGTYLSGVFYGLTTHQTFVYFRKSGNDPVYTRIMVLTLWILDTFHAVLSAVALCKIIQESMVNPFSLLVDVVPWTLSFSLFFISISDTTVRGFYCFRIWRLSQRNWILTSVAVFPIIVPLVAGLYCTSQTIGKTGIQALSLTIELDITFIAICVSDSILTGFLCILLWNSRSGIKRTNSLISTLILYTVTTGLLTSILAIVALIIMLTIKGTFAYAGAFFMLSRFYFSSLLATLNRREKIRTQISASDGAISIPLQTANNTWSKGVNGIEFNSMNNDTNHYTNIYAAAEQNNFPNSQVGGPVLSAKSYGNSSPRLDEVKIKVDQEIVRNTDYIEPEADYNLAYPNRQVTSMV